MTFGIYGILVIFGLFVLLVIFNPNLSCFGKKIRSPFYPLFRKRLVRRQKELKIEDYGFDLGEGQSGLKPDRPDKEKNSE